MFSISSSVSNDKFDVMGSKGARYILLPVYVVNIGLLFAFLLTSGLILAWVTIYRHEECIKELRQMLNEKQTEKQKHLSTTIESSARGDLGKLLQESDISDNEQQPLHPPFERDDSSQRLRRHKDEEHNGPKRRKGRRGKKGEPGKDGTPGQPGFPGLNGSPGLPGGYGPQGPRGDKGDQGDQGDQGGNGEPGNPGIKGTKGDQGRGGQTISTFAHIVGSGGAAKSSPKGHEIYTIVSWKLRNSTQNMVYKNGFLQVGVAGYYFIYSQMFYFDGRSSHSGHEMYIDGREVLKAVYSVVNKTRKFQTQYTSGIFFINKGQRISVGTTITRTYLFRESSSFFGAFLLHR